MRWVPFLAFKEEVKKLFAAGISPAFSVSRESWKQHLNFCLASPRQVLSLVILLTLPNYSSQGSLQETLTIKVTDLSCKCGPDIARVKERMILFWSLGAVRLCCSTELVFVFVFCILCWLSGLGGGREIQYTKHRRKIGNSQLLRITHEKQVVKSWEPRCRTSCASVFFCFCFFLKK